MPDRRLPKDLRLAVVADRRCLPRCIPIRSRAGARARPFRRRVQSREGEDVVVLMGQG